MQSTDSMKYQSWVNIVCGIIIIIFGFNFLGVIRFPVIHSSHKGMKAGGVFSAFVFGIVFSISHTPCVGVWLGSALTAAAASGGVFSGVLLLLTYSLGMAIPFLVAAVVIDKLTALLNSIKKNYQLINAICGFFLVAVGVCMMLGWLSGFVELFEGCMNHSHHHH